MWREDSFKILKPSNAVEVAQPHIHPQDPGDETQVFDDTVDFGTAKLSCDESSSSHSQPGVIPMINNTTLVYIPIRLPCGVQAFCAPEVFSKCPMILRSVQTDLVQIFKILPWSVHSLVKRTKIWINASYAYGSRDDPRVLRHSTAHHQEGWLIHCAHDRPEKARGIEIYSCYDFERMRLHWNGCGLLLHEICHLIHQFCLGLDSPQVQNLYEQARTSGLYENVLRRDWAGCTEDSDMAYGMVDFKEFFAEMSVAYLSTGYRNLDKADKAIMEECSPPLLQPTVADRVLKQHNIADPLEEPKSLCWFIWNPKMRAKPKLRIVNPILQEYALARSCLDVDPCNKFYPFTKGQLKNSDPGVFCALSELWGEIAMWDDLEDDRAFCKSLKSWLPSFG